MKQANAIELEIFKHLFASVAGEMGRRLMRSAYSPNIKERRDFSCALFDTAGSMVAQAAHIPVHLGSAPMSVAAVLDAFDTEAMSASDRFIVNDPYCGGTHLPDVTLVAPVFDPDRPGEGPIFYVANRAHHADVGGISAGSMPMSRHIDEEGVRIGPTRLNESVIAYFVSHSRTPEERRGDLMAQSAALTTGIDRLTDLCRQHGVQTCMTMADALQRYTARMAEALIQSIPDGTYGYQDVLDDDGFGRCDILIDCRLTVEGDRMTVDLRGSDDQVPGPVNAVRSIAVSAVNYVLFCLMSTEVPANGGLMCPVTVLTRSGSVLDARAPAPVAGGNVETSQRVVDVLLGALAQALPARIPAASCGSMNNLTIGGKQVDGRKYAYYETIAGGSGGSPVGPGADGVHTHMTNTLNTPIEAIEHAYPFRIERYALRQGSGGTGLHRGGEGVERVYRMTGDAEITLLADRRTHRPWGLAGGGGGAGGEHELIHADGRRQRLAGKQRLQVHAGDVLIVRTPGGGGWGVSHEETADDV